jgi:negative regulator of sigma E activity
MFSIMHRSSLHRYSALLLSLLLLAAAAGVWQMRTRRIAVTEAPEYSPDPEATKAQVAQLLASSHRADTDLTYEATVTVTANYGGRAMKSVAHIIRAPRKLSIRYLEGDGKGMQSGFNERWFWRQEGGNSPIQAYAEVAYRPDEMAAQRFALMRKNYRGVLLGEDLIDGRRVKVVELKPLHPADNKPHPSRRLWIDTQSGLTLRSDVFNYRGEPIMKSVLSEVVLNPQVPKDAFVPPARMVKAALKNPWMAEEMGQQFLQVARGAGIEPPKPTFLPPGYTFDNVGLHRCSPNSNQKAALSRYGDGINVLTLFALVPQKGDVKASGSQICDFGHGTMAMRHTEKGVLVAVGDLPPATLQRVLDATPIVLHSTKH